MLTCCGSGKARERHSVHTTPTVGKVQLVVRWDRQRPTAFSPGIPVLRQSTTHSVLTVVWAVTVCRMPLLMLPGCIGVCFILPLSN